MAINYQAKGGNPNADSLEDLYLDRTIAYSNALELLWVKVLEIFEYKNLPATLPKRELEKRITQNGSAIVYAVGEDVFVTDVPAGARNDIYGNPRDVTIRHFDETLDLTIGVDCVLWRNDASSLGLTSILSEFAILTAQMKRSFLNAFTMLRTNFIILAKDEDAARAALEFEAQMRNGASSVLLSEELGGIGGSEIASTPVAGQQVDQMISLANYVNAYYWSELGVTLNNNLKSQYQSEDELQKSTGMPLVFQMLAERLEAVRDTNALLGTNIEVKLSGEWEAEIQDDPADETPADETPSDEAPQPEPDVGPETADAPAEGEIPGDEPDDFTRDELIEATETLLDEEVPHAEEPPIAGSDKDHTDEDEER